MKFTKMQGAGNDYVYLNGLRERVEDPERLAVRISDRHFGVGSDGLVLILPSDIADFRMEIYNADGSRAKMCGNASRCVGKYVYEAGMTDKEVVTLETLSGVKTLHLLVQNGKVDRVRVNMGRPVLETGEIPVLLDESPAIAVPLTVGGKEWRVTCVSMGNPHAVVFTQGIDKLDLEKLGPLFERHRLFPQRVNTEFVEAAGPHELRMRVWERGSGETLACGTGACAALVAAVLNGKLQDWADVCLPGGVLRIEWRDEVFMTGPARTVFHGEFEMEEA